MARTPAGKEYDKANRDEARANEEWAHQLMWKFRNASIALAIFTAAVVIFGVPVALLSGGAGATLYYILGMLFAANAVVITASMLARTYSEQSFIRAVNLGIADELASRDQV